jgi:hypothetical protein
VESPSSWSCLGTLVVENKFLVGQIVEDHHALIADNDGPAGLDRVKPADVNPGEHAALEP